VQRAQALQVLGELAAVRWLAAGKGVAGEVMRVPDVIHGGEARAPNILRFADRPPTAMPPKFTPW
jgi:hypothetical protein